METGHFGTFNRLKMLRKEKKLTGEEIAREFGVQKAAYSKKECGRVPFTLWEAKKLSDMLGHSIDYIFFNKGRR